jgi:PAS domain S-box-containing protein
VKIAGTDGRLLHMNASGLEMLEAERLDQVTGRPLLDFVAPEDRDDFLRFGAGVMAGQPGTLVFDLVGLRGTRRTVQTRAVPLVNRRGKVTAMLAVTSDLTARVRAERELARSNERIRLIARAASEALWEWDLVADRVWWGEGVTTLFGYRIELLEGDASAWYRRVHPDDLERVSRGLRATIDGRSQVWVDEYRFQRCDGSYADVLDRGYLVRDETGRAIRMVGAMMDISTRTRAEEELRQSEARRRAIMNASLDAIVTMDAAGRITDWNPQAEQVFGWTAADAVGRPLADLIIPPELRESHRRGLARFLATGDGPILRRRVELEALHRSGRRFPVELTVVPFKLGSEWLFSGFARDISEQKRLEEELRQAQKMEAVGRLAGGIAHDFNNLLTAVSGYAELLAERVASDPQAAEGVEEIRRASQRGAALIQKLLVFGRRSIIQPEVFDAGTALSDMRGMLERLIGEDIRVVLEPDRQPCLVRLDERQFEQVILNLAVNAREAMPRGGTLRFRTFRRARAGSDSGTSVVVSVSDTGAGMDAGTREHVFEPFFTTKPGGTGLGLSTVYGIVSDAGGSVTVHSEPGRGATFEVSLPAVTEGLPAPATGPGGGRPERAGARGTETVLLVEDETRVRQLTSRILERHGYAVIEAESGELALERCTAHPGTIQLLLTDVVMPGLSGRETADRVRELRPEIRVLYMSGYTDDEVLRQGVRAQEVPFLQKPFTVEELTAKVREVLDA